MGLRPLYLLPPLSYGLVSGEAAHVQHHLHILDPGRQRYMAWAASGRCSRNNDLRCEKGGGKATSQVSPHLSCVTLTPQYLTAILRGKAGP